MNADLRRRIMSRKKDPGTLPEEIGNGKASEIHIVELATIARPNSLVSGGRRLSSWAIRASLTRGHGSAPRDEGRQASLEFVALK